MRLSSFRSLCLAIGLGLFAAHAQADVTATSLFQTIPSGTDGNCDGKPIDTMVQEAITLNDKAISAINTLLEPKLFWNGGEEERLAKLATTLWGIQLDKPWIYLNNAFRVRQEDRERLDMAQERYEKANEKLKSDRVNGGKLTCGGKDWLYAKTMEDLGYKGVTVPVDAYVSKYFSEKNDKGEYNIQDKSKIILTPQSRKGVSLAGKSLCADPARAQTWGESHLIMMCDQCFGQPTLSSLWGQKESWPTGKDIDELQTAGAEFQHEMMHYINMRIHDQLVDGEDAYGWELCAQLAKGPEESLIGNADNYRVFAQAVFFDRVQWDAKGRKM